MKTKEIGIMVFLIGTLFLSIQIYLLKIVQKLDKIAGSSFVNELRYCIVIVLMVINFIYFEL